MRALRMQLTAKVRKVGTIGGLMIEVRLHGRGGQGTVVGIKILADAVILGGGWVQAFPDFGVERRGSPVTAFIRIDDQEIFLRSKIYNPDHLVILDSTLINVVKVTEGLKEGGTILINSPKPPGAFSFDGNFKVMTTDATRIAINYKLGSAASPIVNTAILGAVIKALPLGISLEKLSEAIAHGVPTKMENNIAAAREAYESLI